MIPGPKSKPAVTAAPVVTTAATVVPVPTEAPATDIALNEKSLFVEIDRIRMNPRQPRKTFEEKALADLVESVKEKGVLQPLLVCRKGLHYELIAGERRYRASKEAGLKLVPVRILANDQEQLEIALIENLIRSDLNPIEEAKGYEKLQKRVQSDARTNFSEGFQRSYNRDQCFATFEIASCGSTRTSARKFVDGPCSSFAFP
ncbi:MAG: ParB/RepB/Spo0J family partition protein [Bdellovibrionota bacterium]